jgi:hypothetical protein
MKVGEICNWQFVICNFTTKPLAGLERFKLPITNHKLRVQCERNTAIVEL